MLSERFHRAKTFARVVVGHFQMIRHTGRHRLGIPLVAPNHLVLFRQRRQDLGHSIPVGLTDASGSRYSLRKVLMEPLQLLIFSPQVLHLCHQAFHAAFVVHDTSGTVTGVFQVSLPPCFSGAPRMSKPGMFTLTRRR